MFGHFSVSKVLLVCFALIGLAACGGGGGGGGGGAVISTTNINNATFNSTTGASSVTALSTHTNTSTTTTNTSTLTYSGSTITKAELVGPDGNLITFDTNLGDSIYTTSAYGGVTLVGAIKQDQKEQILIANFPSSTKSKIVNHNKLTGSVMYHSVSLQGNVSSVNPAAVTATYTGKLLGTYSSIGAYHVINGMRYEDAGSCYADAQNSGIELREIGLTPPKFTCVPVGEGKDLKLVVPATPRSNFPFN